MAFILISPTEMAKQVSERARDRRLFCNLSQKTLSERSGVSLGVIKKFEKTGKISFESLLKLSLVLDALEEFKNLFKEKSPEEFLSMDDLLKEKKRKRGRQ